MPSRTLLLSIRPEYAEKIFSGIKTAELRKVAPQVTSGDIILIYVSSPVKALLGASVVDRVVAGSPAQLWKQVKDEAGITRQEYDCYYSGAKKGYAILFSKVCSLTNPIELENIRSQYPGFNPPQSYWYIERNRSLLNLFIPFIRNQNWSFDYDWAL